MSIVSSFKQHMADSPGKGEINYDTHAIVSALLVIAEQIENLECKLHEIEEDFRDLINKK